MWKLFKYSFLYHNLPQHRNHHNPPPAPAPPPPPPTPPPAPPFQLSITLHDSFMSLQRRRGPRLCGPAGRAVAVDVYTGTEKRENALKMFVFFCRELN